MKRGNNNVFKLSGNIALGGGGNEYIGTQNLGKGNSYTASSSNTLKRTSNYGQGQSYENNYQYDFNQKAGTSEKRKYSRNQQQNGPTSYNSGLNYGNLPSSKKVDYNYQNALNKLQTAELYNNKGTYNSSYKDLSSNQGSYKDFSNNGNYQAKNLLNKEPVKGTYRNYQDQGYSNNKPSYGSKISQPQAQQYNYQNTRPPVKPTNQKQIYNQPQSKPSTYDQGYNNNYKNQNNDAYEKDQIKQYDPSTFAMCRQGCGRKFNPDSISKHQKICKKVFQNKRPEFNVQQQRIVAKQQKKLMKQGEIVEKKIQQKKKIDQKKQNLPKWKAESLGLRAILKSNRRGGQATQEQKRLIDQAQSSGQTKCKFCGRTFSEKAAQRHIPFCQSQQKKNSMKRKK